jgi:hypothetical protein
MPNVNAPSGSVLNVTLSNTTDVTIISGQPPIVVIPTAAAPIVSVTQPILKASVVMGTSSVNVETVTNQIILPISATDLSQIAQVWGETPTGMINGSNQNYTTAHVYLAGLLAVYLNGIRQQRTNDYSETGSTSFQFVNAPLLGDSITIDYVEP